MLICRDEDGRSDVQTKPPAVNFISILDAYFEDPRKRKDGMGKVFQMLPNIKPNRLSSKPIRGENGQSRLDSNSWCPDKENIVVSIRAGSLLPDR